MLPIAIPFVVNDFLNLTKSNFTLGCCTPLKFKLCLLKNKDFEEDSDRIVLVHLST